MNDDRVFQHTDSLTTYSRERRCMLQTDSNVAVVRLYVFDLTTSGDICDIQPWVGEVGADCFDVRINRSNT